MTIPAAPSVAVIIPAHNEAATVAAVARVAIESRLGEVIVVSDGSTDGTAEAARASGARVIALLENRGKGGAVHAAVQATDAELVLLVDADLVGLEPAHLRDLLAPVASGEADATIGLFSEGRARTDLAQKLTPYLSGQRAVRRDLLERVPGLDECRYAIELAITRQIELEELTVKYVPLVGVSQVMKERKRGFLAGFGHRLVMYWQLLAYAARGKASSG